MNRSQKYISSLLERLPKWELRSYEHQTSLDRIRDRMMSASDIKMEILSLYHVKSFSDFALSLMWIADKVEKDASLDESTIAEETLVFEKLRFALGDTPPPTGESPSEDMVDLPSSPESQPTPLSPGAEASRSGSEPMLGLTRSSESEQDSSQESPLGFIPQSPDATPQVLLDSWGVEPPPSSPGATAGGAVAMGVGQEHAFADLLERFLESVQSGNDDRTTLLSDVINECNKVLAAGSAAEDYKQFCQLLVTFLKYISENQFLDDVRVMNIVSNVQDPLSQWARSEHERRTGLLDPAIEILRDFKTMFE